MSKKNRKDRDGQGPSGPDRVNPSTPGPSDLPSVPATPAIEPQHLTWPWYGKIFAGCVIFSTVLFVAFVLIMKGISKQYTEDGIAMYKMAKILQNQKDRHPDTIYGELAALDAVVDVEKMKSFLLADVAYAPVVTEDTKAWLRQEDEKITELIDHLKEVEAYDDVQRKIRDRAVEKVGVIQASLREIIKNIDMQDREDYKKMVVRLNRKINKAGWYVPVAAGFFSWPAALDAAERSFFEALRFWQKNQDAAYWWGRTLEETSIMDVAAEKKIMAIRFDPDSDLSDSILTEFKNVYEANPTVPRTIYNYAFALYRKGKIDDAVPLYRKVYDMDRALNTFEGFLAKRRLDIIERKIDMRWYKTDDF